MPLNVSKLYKKKKIKKKIMKIVLFNRRHPVTLYRPLNCVVL